MSGASFCCLARAGVDTRRLSPLLSFYDGIDSAMNDRNLILVLAAGKGTNNLAPAGKKNGLTGTVRTNSPS